MCHAVKGKGGRNVFVAATDCHPQNLAVLETRAEPLGIEVRTAPTADLEFDDTVFGVLLQYPATDGAAADYAELIARAHEAGAMVVMATDLLALTLLKAPGELGADIAVGNAQRFGVPLGYGGPHAAFFATHQRLQRAIPGRLVGVSQDQHGQPAYRLALQTREQHIRRHRATSNICTNETLIALMGAMHMSLLGPEGLRDLSIRNFAACQLGKQKLSEIPTIALPHSNMHHYNEFVIELPGSVQDCLDYLDDNGVIGGFDLSNWYPERRNWLLVSFSDQTNSNEIELLAAHLALWSSQAGGMNQ